MRKSTAAPVTPVTEVTARSRPPCECGCGGTPAGRKSRYLSGHDAKHLSATRRAFRDDPVHVFLDEWNLPTDRARFLAWLKGTGLTLAEFRLIPAWRNAPPELVAALDRPRKPSRRPTVQESTSRAAGSDS